tara:strand:+ start:19325 stop:19768 length:444 start_codon:yes stop_codon:yes gene_type:complete
MRIIRQTKAPGQFVAVYDSAGPPDYIAISSGIAFMLEAKNCGSKRWSLSNLHEHQALRLDQWNREGGFAAVLLHFSQGRVSFVLPWNTLSRVWHAWWHFKCLNRRAPAGSASINMREAGDIGRCFDDDGWLNVAVEINREQESGSKD